MRIGLDVGGTKTDAVALDPSGALAGRVRVPTGWGASAVIRTIVEAVALLREDAGIPADEVASIGIGIPGQVEPGTARVVHAVNLGVAELDLYDAVGASLGAPIRVENDVKAAALGASALHGGSGSMAYLNLGTGVAAGIVHNGALIRGVRGTAGEIGHISIDPNGPLCPCGQRGCIEALAGGGSLAQRWGSPGVHPVSDVFSAADAGDARARDLRAGLARAVAAAVRVLVLTVDVDVVVIGGGLTGLGAPLLADVSAELAASAAASPFLRSLRLEERIELLPSGSPAAAVGAALIGDTAGTEVVAHG
ncbi:ROK family protein [Microbacterium sp. SLBN-146]|uniref:ROK family protein n=1 Tax=Microbacterium sp. SLBN-146 TaxID=2768457 RepID=UPI00114E1E5F|nr:ROK family protein [Microbacterium sp. SLBN-146]TQJ29585.1 putative NBD/HSP70 family sugar kinase [Microbacterium sp. SLBN-146]